MASVPAICDSCGTAFPSGIVAEDSYNISFSGVRAGPCPKCGSSGHVPDGLYNFIGSAIAVISASKRTKTELTRLELLVEKARSEENPEPLVTDIQNEFPEFASVLSVLPHNRTELYGFLGLLLALLSYLQAFKPKPEPSPAMINNFFNSYYSAVQPISPTPPIRRKKVGRNEPCPCGSGIKYKKCHGFQP